MQWVGWAFAVEAELLLVIVVLGLIADWPPNAAVVALATTALFPASLVAGTHVGLVARVDRLVAHTVTLAGLTALVILAYVAVVVALGRGVRDDERSLLLLSMAATGFAALAYLPLRTRLTDVGNQFMYGERVAPDDALRTWGSRLTRAIPLDELLLQLVESLRKSMLLASAQIFAGSDGRYELAAAVPHRAAPTVAVGAKERAVIASAGVRGGTWLDVWLPQVASSGATKTRIAPIAHAGDLLGLIVVTRDADGDPFGEENDRVLTELARQVGLALHNVQLDSALQASLKDLQQANAELHESRLRIVSTADGERRKLERNLHDGAQQHLVAMAVKLRIAEELVSDDPTEAVKLIAEFRDNLKDSVAELRALAHGIFPPLLMSGGLAEALPAAAARAALPTTVDTAGVGRHSPEIESTIYFCCLEAMQNAGKHAGVDAEVTVRVIEGDGLVAFEVTDDGIGFTPGLAETGGHGFINMTDRLGAVGGRLEVRPACGSLYEHRLRNAGHFPVITDLPSIRWFGHHLVSGHPASPGSRWSRPLERWSSACWRAVASCEADRGCRLFDERRVAVARREPGGDAAAGEYGVRGLRRAAWFGSLEGQCSGLIGGRWDRPRRVAVGGQPDD